MRTGNGSIFNFLYAIADSSIIYLMRIASKRRPLPAGMAMKGRDDWPRDVMRVLGALSAGMAVKGGVDDRPKAGHDGGAARARAYSLTVAKSKKGVARADPRIHPDEGRRTPTPSRAPRSACRLVHSRHTGARTSSRPFSDCRAALRHRRAMRRAADRSRR